LKHQGHLVFRGCFEFSLIVVGGYVLRLDAFRTSQESCDESRVLGQFYIKAAIMDSDEPSNALSRAKLMRAFEATLPALENTLSI
jgi:hypothetical protein